MGIKGASLASLKFHRQLTAVVVCIFNVILQAFLGFINSLNIYELSFYNFPVTGRC